VSAIRRSFVLGIHRGDVERDRILRLVRMARPLVDPQIAELLARQRPFVEHAFHRLLKHSLGELAVQDELRLAILDAARIAGVVVVDFLVELAAREHDLLGIDDDDVVAAVHVRRVVGPMLAAQPHGDDRGEPADDEPGSVDQHPLFLDLGRLGRIGFHVRGPRNFPGETAPGLAASTRDDRAGQRSSGEFSIGISNISLCGIPLPSSVPRSGGIE
jgi:hypothetical protein